MRTTGTPERRISLKKTLGSPVRSLRPSVDLEKALRLSGELEDAETLRKLALRK